VNIVDRARKFAQRAHRKQVRKYTNEPYFLHLDEVAKLCARHGCSKRAIAAAYLHDTIEDQPVTYEDLVNSFGKDVADIVRDLTDAPPRAGSRKERKVIDLARLSTASPEAQTIKCADLISNTRSIVRHDVGFARTYLPEKRAALTVMIRADAKMRALAWTSLIKAEREIERSGK
jgi:(p)ppGpp synthase/HD superfamily hydrolase